MSTTFNPTLVALSFVISVFGSLTGFQSARRARDLSGRVAFAWLAAAAVSIGGGAIWSVHFIGMWAYHNDVNYRFDLTRTVLSLVVAVAASGVGLYIAGRGRPSVPRYVAGGTVIGLGIAGMHYLGMSAMRMNADLTYRSWVVGVSILVAVVAAPIGLFFAFTVRQVWSMAAVIITPKLDLAATGNGINPLSLALPVFGIASVLLFVLLFVGLFEDTQRDELALTASR
jgi:NO-binding membrane sensor protein with MHYT domain